MQQNLTYKTQQVLLHQKKYFDKLEKVPNGLNSLKNKVDNSDIDETKTVSTKKISHVVDKHVLKKLKYNADKQ